MEASLRILSPLVSPGCPCRTKVDGTPAIIGNIATKSRRVEPKPRVTVPPLGIHLRFHLHLDCIALHGEVEMAAERVEDAAEVVEEVATVAEEVSSELAAMLPEDGKLKDALLLVEHVAKEAVEEAHLVQDIFHKVDEVKQEVEMLLEPGKLMHEEGNIVKRKP